MWLNFFFRLARFDLLSVVPAAVENKRLSLVYTLALCNNLLILSENDKFLFSELSWYFMNVCVRMCVMLRFCCTEKQQTTTTLLRALNHHAPSQAPVHKEEMTPDIKHVDSYRLTLALPNTLLHNCPGIGFIISTQGTLKAHYIFRMTW